MAYSIPMKLSFSKKYFFVFLVVLLVEVCIGLFATDRIVRPLVGDVLVVVLIYAFIRMLFEVRNHYWLAVGVLLFAYAVEVGQYFNLVARLGLADSKFASIVLGTGFDWRDFLCYTLGFVLILADGRRAKDS
jgi:hypothetical protein